MTANRMIYIFIKKVKKTLRLNDGKPYDFSLDAHLKHSVWSPDLLAAGVGGASAAGVPPARAAGG